jgi:hypothetical protein
MPGEENTPCKWADHVQLITDLTEKTKDILISEVGTNYESKILFEEDGFMIETHTDEFDDLKLEDSWISHYCPSKHWKMTMDSAYMATYGVCHHCFTEIPPGIIALWKLHNWDDIQQSGPAPVPKPMLTAHPPRKGSIASCEEWPSC